MDGLVGVLAEPMNSGFRAGFDTIVGLPTAVEWDRLTVRGVDRVLDAARSSYDLTVVCTSPVIEDLRRWVDRYAVSRHVLSVAADVTVGVCEASPRGVLRFLDWLVEYAALSGDPLTRVPVIINKLPAGRTVFGEIVGQLHAISGTRVDVIGGVPFDRRVQRAEWNANAPSRGPYTKAVAHLARQLDASLDLTRQRSDA